MVGMEGKSLNKPDEVRTFDKGKLELINLDGRTVGRATLQPGWRWSQSVKPLVNTKSCEAPHFQYHMSGTLRVKMDDGTEKDFKAGDVSRRDMRPGLLEMSQWLSLIFKECWITQRRPEKRKAKNSKTSGASIKL